MPRIELDPMQVERLYDKKRWKRRSDDITDLYVSKKLKGWVALYGAVSKCQVGNFFQLVCFNLNIQISQLDYNFDSFDVKKSKSYMENST